MFRRNTEKYITFAAPIEKEVTRIDKNREEITKNMSDILQFIDRAKFMANLLSNLVSNLPIGTHRIGLDDKNCETCAIKYISIATVFLNIETIKII